MDKHNELMKYVRYEPEEAALEIARLRKSSRLDHAMVYIAYFFGLAMGAWLF